VCVCVCCRSYRAVIPARAELGFSGGACTSAQVWACRVISVLLVPEVRDMLLSYYCCFACGCIILCGDGLGMEKSVL